tara:strand:- start:122 stop:475 length:354 start_codon:yes stop_codon:yes gene_type:complete
MSRLFVYGTLKRGHRAHPKLERHNAVYVDEAVTSSRYHLYRVGWFPGMVFDEDIVGGVHGELYEVTEDCFEALDIYEGAPSLFRREEITLADGTKAISYLFNQRVDPDQRIESGVFE